MSTRYKEIECSIHVHSHLSRSHFVFFLSVGIINIGRDQTIPAATAGAPLLFYRRDLHVTPHAPAAAGLLGHLLLLLLLLLLRKRLRQRVAYR